MASANDGSKLLQRVTALETGFDAFKGRVTDQIDELKKIMAWGLTIGLGAIIAVWCGIAVVVFQVNDLRTRIAVIETKLISIEDRTKEALEIVKTFQVILTQLQIDSAAIKAQLKNDGKINIPLLNDSDLLLIQKSIPSEITKVLPTADQLRIGDVVTDPATLNSLPDIIAQRVPQLQGTRFTLGKGVVVFVNPIDSRVVAIVPRA